MLQAEDPREDASAVLRAIQVENEALQRAILSRKAEPPSSLLQVQVRASPGGGTRRCLSGACTEHVVRREDVVGIPDLTLICTVIA